MKKTGYIKDQGRIRAVIRNYSTIIWIEPLHSETVAEARAKAQAKLREVA